MMTSGAEDFQRICLVIEADYQLLCHPSVWRILDVNLKEYSLHSDVFLLFISSVSHFDWGVGSSLNKILSYLP